MSENKFLKNPPKHLREVESCYDCKHVQVVEAINENKLTEYWMACAKYDCYLLDEPAGGKAEAWMQLSNVVCDDVEGEK